MQNHMAKIAPRIALLLKGLRTPFSSFFAAHPCVADTHIVDNLLPQPSLHVVDRFGELLGIYTRLVGMISANTDLSSSRMVAGAQLHGSEAASEIHAPCLLRTPHVTRRRL